MLNEMLIAGFGGQGIVSLGKLIAYAGMLEGNEVSCWSRYGAEMRGGTAQCTVILSSETIDSPVVNTFDIIIAMNQPSMIMYQDKVKPKGRLFWNKSVCLVEPEQRDVEQMGLDATNIAKELGSTRMANIVFLGCLSQKTGLFSLDSAHEALKRIFTKMTPEMLKLNKIAIQKGSELVDQ
ncbi:2-oxoacid:acceptor oxidoreductase family protein [Thermodesulfobacteriota bacterium]